MQIILGTQTATLAVGAVSNIWQFAAFHVIKLSSTTSEICAKLSGVTMACATVTAVLTEAGTMRTRIG